MAHVVCLRNEGYEASPDEGAAEHGVIRVVDESGEDYLFPKSFFAPVEP